MKKGKKKNSTSEGSFKKTFRLVWGSVLAVGAFFLTAYIVEFAVKKDMHVGVLQKSLPLLNEIPVDAPEGQDTDPAHSPLQFSFFETLFQKEEKDEEKTTLARQKALAVNKVQEAVRKILPDDTDTTETDTEVFSIQLGSFQNKSAAVAFIETLKSRGYSPYIMAVPHQDGMTLYRVRIGRFENREDAFELAQKIEQEENITVLVTSR